MTVFGIREGTPAGDIVSYIQRKGSATVKELEDALAVSTTAVREQLTHLTNQGLIAPTKIRQGPGRPSYRYTLTAKAQSLFPKGYDVLLNVLLEEILATEGAEGMAQLLSRVGTRLATLYTGDHPANVALRERLMQFVYTMNRKGMSINVAESPGGGWVVSEYACPYFEVAQTHDSLCSMERQMMETALGHEVEIQRRMVEGHNGCHFVIKADEIGIEKHN
ncbi:DeoR family transcriptional regulator [Herpetosiphon gulosus]|uniref:HTH deoR-type domain-containing protein n=1 Tax=Herpetosiphon gulosus TaxID=1973496 RepID=A0ABP9WX37_9CHLR